MENKHRIQGPPTTVYEQILSCEKSVEVGRSILAPIADMLGARSSVFLQLSSSSLGGRHFGARDYVGDTPAAVDAYLNGLYIRDPVMQPAMEWLRDEQRPMPTILTGSVDANLGCDQHYRDSFLRPYDIGHVVALAVPMKTGFVTQIACVGFHRRHSDKGFRPEQISCFRRLSPAIRWTLYGLACQESQQLSDTITQAAQASGSDLGYIILDEDLVVRNANARGMEDLGLVKFQTSSPLLGEIKQRLLAGDLEGNGHFSFKAVSSCPVGVHVRNFRSINGDPYYLIATTSAGPQRSIGDACRKYGLTDRETEIAILVAAGNCNASLSKELGISLRTGENHLRSIYRKVGISSRTQLISRLLQIQ